MKFLTNHGEKLVCAVVVILCAFWIFQTLGSSTAEKQKEIKENEQTIKSALETNTATDAFVYHPAKVASYGDDVKERMNRAETSVGEPLIARAFYPQPERPVVEIKVVEKAAVEVQEAVLTPFKGLSAEGQQGMVVVNCIQPDKILNFVPVRIEIQRGTTPDKFTDPVHVIELGPETAVVKTGDATKKSETAEVESADEKSGTTARSIRRQPTGIKPAAKKDDKGKTKPSSRFEDVKVTAQTTYYYRARLVARLETLGPNNVIFREGKEVTIVVPPTIERVKGSVEGVELYASPWSTVEKATVPSDFELRFNFVTGTIPSDPRAQQVGYSAFLGVRLWDTEVRAWGESSFEVPVGQPIKGKLKFKVGTSTKIREFDTGLVLDSVRPGIRFEVEKIREPMMQTKTDDSGETVTVPVMDESNQPKWREKLVPRRIPTQVAILRVGDTEKQIRLIKGLGYEDKLDANVKILLEGEAEPVIEQPGEEAPAKPAAAPATTPAKPAATTTPTAPAAAPAPAPVQPAPAPAATPAKPAATTAPTAPATAPAATPATAPAQPVPVPATAPAKPAATATPTAPAPATK